MHAEILLPAGTTKLTVREIPYLLSKAIHPDIPETAEKIVSYLHKQNAENIAIPASRTEELTDDEWAVLNAIWHHLPPFRQGMTESEWEHYAEAFEHAKHRPEWGLMIYWRNLVTEVKILQIDAEAQHKNLLNTAILNGEVTPFNHAQVLSPNYTGEALMNAFISVEDFIKYVARFPAIRVKVITSFTAMNPVKASKAPAPISPIRGSYTQKASNNDRQPRWGKWQFMGEVTLWEAVALSLNIEPGKVQTDGNAWMGADHPFDEGDSFNDRLAVIRQHSSNRTYFPTPCSLNIANWYACKLRLDEFASWCTLVKYDIPQELVSMTQGVQTTKPALDKEELPLQANPQKPWKVADPNDPDPAQPWFTPARYFARQLVIGDSKLLNNRNLLANKTSQALFNAGIFGRTKNKALDAGTILKAFINISLG